MLRGHEDEVIRLCPLPQGQLASSSLDGTIRIWQLETDKSQVLQGSALTGLCSLPGHQLAGSSYGNLILLWDPNILDFQIAESRKDPITTLCQLADGRVVVAGRAIYRWDYSTKTFEELNRPKGPFPILACCELADGRLAFGAHTVWLLNLVTNEISVFPHHGDKVVALCELSDGRLACATDDGALRLVSIDAMITDRLGRSGSSALCLLPDGRLASGSDGEIKLWDMKTRNSEALKGRSAITALCSPLTRHLVSGCYDGSLCVWDLLSERLGC